MIGQEEKRTGANAPQPTHHTSQQQQQPRFAKCAESAHFAQNAASEEDTRNTVSTTSKAPCSKSSCGSKMYALSFIIPAATVGALYLPDAINSGNCALATIPAVLAGTTAFGLYRFCKFIKHKR